DGHDKLAGRLLYRPVSGDAGRGTWRSAPLQSSTLVMPPPQRRGSPERDRRQGPEEDRWWAAFTADQLGAWEYTVEGWVDAWETWTWGFERKLAAGQDVAVELLGGAALVGAAAERARGDARKTLQRLAERLADRRAHGPELLAAVSSAETAALMRAHPD